MAEPTSNSVADRNRRSGEEAAGKGTIAFDDAALVDRSRKGDMQAFGLLVAKYRDRLFNVIYRMCGRRADAEELSQEAFLKALERICQFRGNSGFYTWLFRIGVNLTISHRRRAGRIHFHSLTGPDDTDGSQADVLTAAIAARRETSPAGPAMTAETQARILEALQSLDEEFRLVAVLRDIEDMDYAEIARVLDVPVGTVKSRLHRARTLLKDKLRHLVE